MLETIPNTKFKAAGRASPQKGRPGRNPAAILKSENGDVNYFSTVVFIFIAVLLLAFILDLFSIISTKQELDHCADQMVKQIQLSEGINGETEQLFNFLCSQIEGAENISYSIDASYKSPTPSGMSRAIQLGTPFYITITGRAKLGGFWNFNLVNITVVSRGAGVSEHYWRRMKMKQNLQVPSKVRAQHLNREALVYVRQSTMAQVRFNQESTQRQYALRERALLLGWPEEHIRVIDGDLGISGSGRSKRPGFAQLVTSVSLGEVGAVLGLEISRLARSSADLMKLLELCGLFGTLVIDEDGIYDMSDFNDRLLIGLKGTMGEAELHFLHARMIGGKENAASRGELRFPLPVGYIYDASGRTIMDPDEGVQHALSTLFQAFRTSGSAYGIVRYFAENNLSFPKRAYGGAWDGKVTWGTLTHSRVLGVIHNPAYAGAYVYGRYRDNKTIDADGHFEHHPVRLPDKEDWKVFLPGHHQAYISWEEFEENQKRLASNQTNMERRGPAREGAALLTGVLLCGKCGRRMTVRYTGTGGICPLYECIGRWEHGNKATCSSVPARALDQAVSEKILSIMKPSELEISLKVMRSINDADRMSDKQWLLSVERAQYEADRAERQFMLADPENRLVVRSLEANWNQKLKELEKAKQDYAIYSSKKAWIPSEKEEQDILNLAQKIPEIWNAPTSTPKEKKRIVRILIDDITVLAEKRCPDFGVGIRFRSGKCEQLSLKKNLPYGDRRRHTDSTISRIHELAAALDDPGIADRLNQDGYVTPEGKPFTYAGVRWIRYKYDISGPYERNRQGISVAEAAGLLGISADRVYYGISVGKIPARKQHQGWPWEVLIDDSNLESIKALYT